MQIARRRAWILSGLLLLLCWAGPGAAAEDLVYTVQPGDNLIRICGKYRSLTGHYSLTDLLTEIRQVNGLESNFLRVGRELTIPIREPENVPRAIELVRDGAEMRGIYLTGPACGVSSVLRRVDAFIQAGGNAVVFDAKDIDGGVSFASGHPLASWGNGRSTPVISSLDDMMSRFERRDLYVVARLALFLDGELGRQRPDLALQGPDGEPWTERGCYWMDPSRREVRQYNLELAAELARAGVDEIQFDYVRFPTNGWQGDALEGLDPSAVAMQRRDVLDGFLSAARDTLNRYGVRISADLYGIMAWGRIEDQALTGQHVPTIARYVDVICPMIYPSHFGTGFEGHRRPADDPEYFVSEGTRRFLAQVPPSVEIRPWLQAFPYGVESYDARYVARQVVATREAGGAGWCLWSPTCSYGSVLAAVGAPLSLLLEDPLVAAVESVPNDESQTAESDPRLPGLPAGVGGTGALPLPIPAGSEIQNP